MSDIERLLRNEDKIFVNRQGPKRKFEDIALGLPAKGSTVLTFHGPGGQGKTALCDELFRLTAGGGEPSFGHLCAARVNLANKAVQDRTLLLVRIRNQFAKTGVAFPCFDIALGLAWKGTRGEEPFPVLEKSWLGKSTDAATDMAPSALQAARELIEGTVATIPGLGTLAVKGAKGAVEKTRRFYLERTRETLTQFRREGALRDPAEISGLLPWGLAEDLNHHLGLNQGHRFVLFVDQFDELMERGGTGKDHRDEPSEKALQTLAQYSNGFLMVILSREDPKWKISSGTSLVANENLALEGLKKSDADDWLKQVGVDRAEIRDAITEGARDGTRTSDLKGQDKEPSIYPIMIDLQIHHWHALVASGVDLVAAMFHISVGTFEDKCAELVTRLLQGYGDALQLTLKHLAVADRFDQRAFECVVEELGTRLPSAVFDRITRLSLVTRHDDGYLSLHDVVTKAIRSSLNDGEVDKAREILLKHFEERAAVTSLRDVTDESVAALLEAVFLKRQGGAKGLVSWLAEFTSDISGAARYEIDEQIWRDTLITVSRELGGAHPDAASSYNNVAFNLAAQGRYEEAEPLYRKALSIRQATLGEAHPDTALSYNNVASNLNAQGRYDEADPLFRKALSIQHTVLSEAHPSTASSYNNLAANLNAQGRYDEADPLYRKALSILEKALGEAHPNTASSYNNVASNLNAQGRYDEADPLFRKALLIRQTALGEAHPDTASSYNNVAANMDDREQYEEAEPLYRKALSIRRTALGEAHPNTASSYNNVASNLNAQGRYDEAEPPYRNALSIRQTALGEAHPDTASSYNNVAANMDALRQYEEAEPLYRKALSIRRTALGETHPDTASSYNNLASNLVAQGRYEEAEPLLRKAVEIVERALGPGHPNTITLRKNFEGFLTRKR